MKLYVPCLNMGAGRAMSEYLWALSMPAQARGEARTARLFAVVEDAAGGAWLEMLTGFSLPVHEEAVLGELAVAWAAMGVPQGEIDGFGADVMGLRGQRMTLWERLPQSLRDAAKLREEITWPTKGGLA